MQSSLVTIRRMFMFTLCVMTPFSAAPLLEADDILDAIPESASVVIRAKSPQKTIEKIAAFANNIDPSFGPFVQVSAGGMGVLISNPTLAGVDQSQDWCVAVFPKAEGDPEIVFSIPATDAETLSDALGDGFFTNIMGTRVLYSESETAMKAIAERLAGKTKSIADVMDSTSRQSFDEGDISVYANVRLLTEIYETQLEEAEIQMEEGLNEAKQMAQDFSVEGVDVGGMYAAFGEIGKQIFQAVRDTEGVTAALNVDAEAVTWQEYVRAKKGSKFDKFLLANPSSNLNLLNRLPSDQLAYYGIHGDMNGLISWAGENMSELMGAGGDEEKAKELKALFAEYKNIDLGQQVGSFTLGDLETGAIRATSMMEVSPMEKFQRLLRKMTQTMGSMNFGQMGFKQEAEIQEEAEKYGEHAVDVIRIKQQFNEEQPFAEIQKKMMQTLYGPDGMTNRMAYLDKIVVQTMGGGRASMESALKSANAKPAESGNEELLALRGRLESKANILVAIDLPTLVAQAINLAIQSEELPIPFDGEALGELEIPKSYFGFSCTAEPQGLRIRGAIPVKQAQAGYKLGMFFYQQAMMPQEAR